MLDWLKKMLFEVEDEVTEPEPQNIQTPAPEAVFIDIVERNEFFPDMKEEEFEVTKPLPQKQPDYWLSAVISPIYGEVTSPIKVMSEEPPLTPTVKQEKSGYLGTIISPMYGNAKQEIKPLTAVEPNPEVNINQSGFPPANQQPLVNNPPIVQAPVNQEPVYNQAPINQTASVYQQPIVQNPQIIETELPLSFDNQPAPVPFMTQAPQANPNPVPPNVVPTNDYDQYLEIKKVFPDNPVNSEEVQTIVLPSEPQSVPVADFLPPDSELFGVEPPNETEELPVKPVVEKAPIPPLRRSKPKVEVQVTNDSLFDDFEANFATTELNTLPDDFGKTEEVKFNKLDLFDGE